MPKLAGTTTPNIGAGKVLLALFAQERKQKVWMLLDYQHLFTLF
jgi:hypothetical protein